MEVPAALARLWLITGGRYEDPACDWREALDPIGLILFAPPRNGGYWCTPTNSVAFATTGGDGVHYSWLQLPELSVDFAPIVMTVPCSDVPNVIVGANLREFLCLGCIYGYFALEQLVYRPEETLEALAGRKSDPEQTPVERAMLQRLSGELELTPWVQPGERLAALSKKYLSSLVLPESVDVA